MIPELFITHGIKGFKHHFFCDGGIYQMSYCPRKRTLPEQVIKKITIGTCRGYKIDGKFYSLTYLEKIRYCITAVVYNIPDKDLCPF